MALPLPVHSYRREQVGARLVNCFAEPMPPETKGPARLVGAPGIASTATLGTGPGRGLHVMAGVLYGVSGTTLYSVSGGTATSLGTIPGTDRVSMADNGSQLVIVANGSGYVYEAGTLAAITDPDFRPAEVVDFCDNFMLFVESDSGRFFSSDLADATAYDALDFATAEGAPDNLVTLIVDHRQVILFGERATEIWYNSGATGFPFERVPSGFIEQGCIAKYSVAKIDNGVFWLADDLTVRRLQGDTPQIISQHGVEEAIRKYAVVSDAEAFTYTLDGHLCYVLTFPTANATWVYDITTQEWHERETYEADAWDVVDAAYLAGRVYVQRRTTGAVGLLSPDTYAEWGENFRKEWTYGNAYAMNARVLHKRLELVAETGVGSLTTAPEVWLEYSNDGGATWSVPAARDLGLEGQRKRVFWNRLGSGRDRVYRMRVSDAVRLNVYGTELDVEPLGA